MHIPNPIDVHFKHLIIEKNEKCRRLKRLKIVGLSLLSSAFILCTLGMLLLGNTPKTYTVTEILFQTSLPPCKSDSEKCRFLNIISTN